MIGMNYSIDVSCCSYLRYRIFATFGQYHSCLLGNSDTMVLKHEHGHFDICELYGRKMRKCIHYNALAKYTNEYFTYALDSIYNCQHKYDSLSDYGENEKQIKLN
jgi:hypothetical protein